MKNITVSVDEEVHRQARIHAAQHGTFVSALPPAACPRMGCFLDTNVLLYAVSTTTR